MAKVRLEENKIITASEKFYMHFTDRTPLGRREYARAVAPRGSPRPDDEGVEGPQQEWLGDPGSSREPLHVQYVCKNIFYCSIPGARGTCLFSFDFNDKKFSTIV
jgi:hypothetical protein